MSEEPYEGIDEMGNWAEAKPLTDEEVRGLLINAYSNIAVTGCFFRLLKTLLQRCPEIETS
jgi:hypothetical protein